jgi:hypothetical protein
MKKRSTNKYVSRIALKVVDMEHSNDLKSDVDILNKLIKNEIGILIFALSWRGTGYRKCI